MKALFDECSRIVIESIPFMTFMFWIMGWLVILLALPTIIFILSIEHSLFYVFLFPLLLPLAAAMNLSKPRVVKDL